MVALADRNCRLGLACLMATMGFTLAGPAFSDATLATTDVHRISVEGMAFSPDRLEVRTGDILIWKNKDLVPHNVTATDGSFSSPVIAPVHFWKLRIRKAGDFSYYCNLHPSMKARLVVK